jgi:hypothetical protein
VDVNAADPTWGGSDNDDAGDDSETLGFEEKLAKAEGQKEKKQEKAVEKKKKDTSASLKGGAKVAIPESVVREMIMMRIEEEQHFNDAGNGNGRKKDDTWDDIAARLEDNPDISHLVLPEPEACKNKWNNCITTCKNYFEHCNKSGEENVATPKILVLVPELTQYCMDRPDVTCNLSNSAAQHRQLPYI